MKTLRPMIAAPMAGALMIFLSIRDLIGSKIQGHMARAGLLTSLVTLRSSYGGYQAGQTVGFTASTEAALIASGQAVNGTTVTAGPLSTNQRSGVCAVLAGQGSVVITNPLIKPQARMWAMISQPTADATALYVARVVTSDGFATIYVNANATAATQIDWSIAYDGTLVTPS
jgi:hypothetical protein